MDKIEQIASIDFCWRMCGELAVSCRKQSECSAFSVRTSQWQGYWNIKKAQQINQLCPAPLDEGKLREEIEQIRHDCFKGCPHWQKDCYQYDWVVHRQGLCDRIIDQILSLIQPSLELAKKAGREEVVEWLNDHIRYVAYIENGKTVRDGLGNYTEWQAQLKEWGIER